MILPELGLSLEVGMAMGWESDWTRLWDHFVLNMHLTTRVHRDFTLGSVTGTRDHCILILSFIFVHVVHGLRLIGKAFPPLKLLIQQSAYIFSSYQLIELVTNLHILCELSSSVSSQL